MTADLGSLHACTGSCTLPLSGHKICLPSLSTRQPPPWCPDFIPLLVLPFPPLYAWYPFTWHLSLTCWFPAQHMLTFFLFRRPAKPPLFRAFQTSVLVSYCLAWWSCENQAVSFGPTVRQWELRRSTHPFPSCFPYNPKFLASRLLGLPLDFMLVSCWACSTLKMGAACSSETSIDFWH